MVLVQKLAELPKVGDRVGVEMFHVSKMNVRFGEHFGEDQDDKNLIANLKEGKIVQPFKARREASAYGVFIGSRRFLGKKTAGVKSFVVGVDCLIEEMTDEEAREVSLIENLFRKDVNPIVRAKKLDEIVMGRGESLRVTARRWGIPATTLCEWLSVLKLTSKMQEMVSKQLLSFSDGLMVTRLNLDTEQQDMLAEVLETQGIQAFKKLVKKGLTERQITRKRSKNEKSKIKSAGKVFWKELTESLREFASYWSDLCTLREWQDKEAYYLNLQVTAPKHSDEPIEKCESLENPDGLETLSADEAPQICAVCGQGILEGDPFSEKDCLYYCRKCANEGLN
jgi:ParB family chromosome partitioning protein